jgi:hypothetical protein
MPRYRFVFTKGATEIEAHSLSLAYEMLPALAKANQAPDLGILVKVECGVEPFLKPKTLYVEESWDEWRYRLEIVPDSVEYSDVVRRLWINSRMDGSGYWIEMPHNYTNPAPRGADPTNAASIVEKYADEYWEHGR